MRSVLVINSGKNAAAFFKTLDSDKSLKFGFFDGLASNPCTT